MRKRKRHIGRIGSGNDHGRLVDGDADVVVGIGRCGRLPSGTVKKLHTDKVMAGLEQKRKAL